MGVRWFQHLCWVGFGGLLEVFEGPFRKWRWEAGRGRLEADFGQERSTRAWPGHIVSGESRQQFQDMEVLSWLRRSYLSRPCMPCKSRAVCGSIGVSPENT
jgi:hypothetical protein